MRPLRFRGFYPLDARAALPAWILLSDRDVNEAGVAVGITLKSLDDLIRAAPPCLGCCRDRLVLKSVVVAARMLGRNEGQHALRAALLMTGAGDDPGPAGKLFSATRMLTRGSGTITTPVVKELAALVGIRGMIVLPRFRTGSMRRSRPGEQHPSQWRIL